MQLFIKDGEVLKGRRMIMTDLTEINASNVLGALSDALPVHRINRNEIQYLWNYYRGEQDILMKDKKVRPEINNKIVVNKASQIVNFKVNFVAGEPITYITRKAEDNIMDAVNKLNEAFYSLGKFSQDTELIKWCTICGTSYRYISTEETDDEIPFNIYTLDPRTSFVVYSSNIKHKPMFAVSYYVKTGNVGNVPLSGINIYSAEVYEVYTDKMYFRIEDGEVVEQREHYLGAIPIVEYPANTERQGAFEIVLPLLNALNASYSDRLDSIDSFVQAFMKFVNCDIDNEGLELLKDYGAIKIKSEPNLPADVDIVSSELDQGQAQTMVDSIEQQIIVICGLPNRNGALSTSDTGKAVTLRDGWEDALCRARDTERAYKQSDKNALKIILKICKIKHFCDLNVSDIEAQFTMHNYENLQSKSQVFISMLQNEKVHPKLAFDVSGMFIDPESAYKMSMEYYEEEQKKAEEKAKEIADRKAITANADNDNEQGSSKTANEKQISNPILKTAEKQNKGE